MELRSLGRTGLRVSALGFGCGDVGGLIVKGTPAERERAVARAVEAGINYFDTASSYGSGESERNLGRTLKAVGVHPYVGTKFRVDPAETDLAGAIARSLEASLERLGLDSVDLFQLHNLIVREDGAPAPGRGLTARRVLDEVVPALAALRRQGKIRFAGITALGDTGAVHTVIDAGVIDTAQVCLNILNPSAAVAVPAGFPAQDFGRLLDRARHRRVGVINIRVLAAGALSGTMQRHGLAMPSVAPSRPAPTTPPTSSTRSGCGRSSTRATPRTSSRPPSGSRSPATLSRPCWSGTPRWSIWRRRSPRSSGDRCRRRRSTC